MAVRSLNIKQFRQVHALHANLPPGLTILIGKNTTGKSNVLEAIASLAAPVNDGDFTLTVEYNHQAFNVHNGQLTAEAAALKDRIAYIADSKVLDAPTTLRGGVLSWARIAELFTSLRANEPALYDIFSKTLATFFPGLHMSNTAPFDGPLVSTGGEPTTVTTLGAGFQQVFSILVAVFSPQISVVLIDEPETHLHPSAITLLRTVLSDAAVHHNKQVVIATHSPLFLTPAFLSHTLHLVRNQTTEAFTAARARLNAERLEQELTPDVGEAFFADAVLMVEGVADKLIMRALWDRFGDRHLTIKIVDVGGKGNFSVYRDLFAAFGIPYFTMVDRDALRPGSAPLIDERLAQGRETQSKPESKILFLQTQHIFVLPHGPLESHYPRRFQSRDLTKPIAALHAGRMMTREDYDVEAAELKRVIEAMKGLTHG